MTLETVITLLIGIPAGLIAVVALWVGLVLAIIIGYRLVKQKLAEGKSTTTNNNKGE